MNFLNRIRFVWAWMRPILESNKSLILSIILPLAQSAILGQSNLSLSNVDKKAAALALVKDGLVEQGVNLSDVSESLLELGFNLAFQRMRTEGTI